jgi:hypothetical protein
MKNQSLNKDEIYYKTKMIDFILHNHKKAIFVSEFPFNFQKRRADILTIDDDLTHAIEIKSDIDNIYKLNSQIEDYLKSFNKVSIFISTKHIKVINTLHKNIGIFILKNDEIVCKRKPKTRKKLDKRILLDFLSTPEIKTLYKKKVKSTSRIDLISNIENKISLQEINKLTVLSLKNKITPTFKLFIHERINETTIHDLSILEIRNTLL